MAEIYRLSGFLLIYVGEVDENERDDIRRLFSRAEEIGAVWFSSRPESRFKSVREMRQESDFEIDILMDKFMSRTWFSRIWIAQEAVSQFENAGLVCGPYAIQLMHLVALEVLYQEGSKGILKLRNAFTSGTTRLIALHARVKRKNAPTFVCTAVTFAEDLLWLLRWTGDFKATEGRDRIYALLSLCATSSIPTALKPSYECSIESVYHAYTKYLIETTGDFSVLMAHPVRIPFMPSWVVDLDFTSTQPNSAKSPFACASNVSFSTTGYIMEATGFRYDRTSSEFTPKKVPFGEGEDMIGPLTVQIRRVEHHVVKKSAAKHPSINRDNILNLLLEPLTNVSQHKLEDLVETYNFLLEFHAPLAEEQVITNLDKYTLGALVMLTRLYTYVVSDTGKIGTIIERVDSRRPYTKRGDIFCLLKGSPKSIILRENTESDTYSIVTICSVHEIDDEFIAEDAVWSDVALETFAII